ncbi:MAG: ABC transporter permease [Candidatus Krumholzibacteriota bacterium]|nr:ABC transporter permease [Candidatus Krumholzibacteriota bacterium]
MAVPLIYNLRSISSRWTSTLVAVLGIAGTVGVFLVMLAMSNGFRATLSASGSSSNAIILRGGATAEIESAVDLEQAKIISDMPGIARSASNFPLVSNEVVVIAAFPLAASGTDANVQVRGASGSALEVRPVARMVEGRMFNEGLPELVIGRNVAGTYAGLDLGSTIRFGGGTWKVVGVFDAGGSSFDSELWCDATVLSEVYKRPVNIFQSVTVRLSSPELFQEFKDAVTADPRLTVDVFREDRYYAQQSSVVATMINVLGFMVALVMAVGAVFAALNTMYSAVAARTREVATLRALGFSQESVMFSFMIESMAISLVGGALGCLAALPFNGFTAGTINWQTFSHLAFAFRVTPGLLLAGLAFALLMGIVGGTPPALRAARLPVVVALRRL